MITNSEDNTYGRAPIRFLNVLEKDKAAPEEIMMDYTPGDDFGHLYMKSKTTDKVIDLEHNLKDITEANAADIKVVIDGIETTLYDLLYTVKMTMGNVVTATPAGEDLIYIQKQFAYDQISVETANNFIQLRGFDTAPNLRLPMKIGGVLKWVTASDIAYIMNNGVGQNPDDGKLSSVIDIYPENDKIYLLATKRHLTKFLTEDTTVILPETVDAFVEISWCLITNSFAPKLSFFIDDIGESSNNIKWGTIPNIVANSTHVFSFRTWNNGQSWTADIQVYSN